MGLVRVGVRVRVRVGVTVRVRVSNPTNPNPHPNPNQVLLREGVHDVQALADLLADPRLNAHWFRTELSMSMGDVVSLLHQARELLSLKPGGALAKRAGDEFERRAADSW